MKWILGLFYEIFLTIKINKFKFQTFIQKTKTNKPMNSKITIFVSAFLMMSLMSFAQLPKALGGPAAENAPDSSIVLLDKAMNSFTSGNNAATAQALTSSINTIEKQSANSSGEFKDKLIGQLGNLKKLIPLAQAGTLNGNLLQKAISLVKLAMGANKLNSLLGGNNLLGNVAGLSSGLNLMKGGFANLEGEASKTGSTLISSALSSVNLLKTTGKSAEPAVQKSIGSVLDLAKGLL